MSRRRRRRWLDVFETRGCVGVGWLNSPPVGAGSLALSLLLLTGNVVLYAEPAAAQTEAGMWSGQSVAFEIPAQSLDRALLAYGSETGIQILYDAGLVAGKRSNSVSGHFAPQQGLELLLRGTGLRVRYTSPGAITLASVDDPAREVLALNVMRVEAEPLVIGDTRRFNGYGESLQADIIAALRRHPITSHGSYEVVLRVWVGADGAIARSELLGSTRQPGQDQAILDAVEGVGVGRKPPADMPQPILFRFRAQPID